MVTTVTLPSLDTSVLLNYYAAKLPVAPQSVASTASATNSATANDNPPWESLTTPSQQAQDAQVLSTTKFIDTSNVPQNVGSADAKIEQDNQKLFSLYQAVNTLSNLASIAQRDGETSGQLVGLNTRFQQGLQQVESFLKTETFNNFTLQTGQPSASASSTVSLAFPPMTYAGGTVVNDTNLSSALPNVSASQSFDVSVTKSGATTDVPIDLSQVQGPLTLDNIVSYVNQQLSAAGFSSRFQRVITQGSIDDPTNAKYGIAITPAPSEKISLSSAAATPALYLAGTTGSTTGTADNPTPDNQGRLVKLTNLGSSPQGVFNATAAPETGTTTAQSTVVDAQGNVYVVGNATGNFGNQLNQGTQDVYLSKYDSAGNLQWTSLLGSNGMASGLSLALNPNGGVVVAGSTTADLVQSAVADGNNDSFVASYDSNGNQNWVSQIPTLNNNQAAAVSVDSSGNVYIGGQVTGVVGKGQTSSGKADAYVAKLDSKGKISYEQQFGTSGNDSVAATAIGSGGSLYVASVQNGHAIVSKYANGDATSAPAWSEDLGDLQNGGAIGGLVVSGTNVYLSGTTTNASLTAGGQASIATASSGGMDAFVVSLSDNGASASANTVSYVGTSGTDKGGALTVGSDGTVYLAGSTTGTFAGQVRTSANTSNMFVAALGANGSVAWTRQYGGMDGQSTGSGIAFDTQGSSVLDALGLPRGTVTINQSLDLTSQSTLRAGDTFQIAIQGTGARTPTITIDKGETLDSLVNKINAAMLNSGTASITYKNGGEALQIKMNAGVTATLVAGPADFDALARLGIPAGTLSGPATSSGSSSTSTSTSAGTAQVYGLGITGTMDISTQTGAGAARAELLNVLSAVRNAYRTSNTPASSTSTAAAQSSGPAPAYLTSQLANYTLALNVLGTGTSTSA
ncbi:MAG TPA: hypothetical protein VGM17_05610 [Rhizomicrobium sp.]|jgi:hypothetical protein